MSAPNLDPERWRQVKDLFEQAADLDAAARAPLLGSHPDPAVRAEAARLLTLHDSASALDALAPPISFSLRRFRTGDLVAQRYRIEEFLGSGGFGEVYRALDQDLQESVAIKIIHQDAALDEAARHRFLEEARLARRVTSPSVCRLYDIHWHGDAAVLSMEFLPGETLQTRIQSHGPLPEPDARQLLMQLLEGIAAAHEAGVVHGDLKPANVLLTGRRAVIADFGLARAVTDVSNRPPAGTLLYMAPEQIRGEPPGPAADLYALGALAYELLEGQPLFAGVPTLALGLRKSEPAPLPKAVSRDLAEALQQCLHPDPARRPNARQMLALLRGRLSSARRRWIAAAVLLAILVPAAWFWWTSRPYQPAASAILWTRLGVAALHEGSPLRAKRLLEAAIEADPRDAISQARLAQALAGLDDVEAAQAAFINASELAQRYHPADPGLLAAAKPWIQRDFAAAETAFTQRAKLNPDTTRILDLAMSQNLAGHTERALESLRVILAQEPTATGARIQRAAMLSRLQRTPDALAELDLAANEFDLKGSVEGTTEVLLRKANLFAGVGRLPEARLAAEQAAAKAQFSGSVPQLIQARFATAEVDAMEERITPARQQAADAVELARGNGHLSLAAKGLIDLGNTHLAHYQLKEAEMLYNEAVTIARQAKSRFQESRAILSLASLDSRNGQPERALARAQQVLPFLQAAGYREAANAGRSLIVQLSTSLGRFPEALQTAESLCAAATQTSDRALLAQCESDQAYIHQHTGAFPLALKHYQASAKAATLAGRKMANLYARANQAEVLWQAGQAADAHRVLDALEREGVAPDIAAYLDRIRASTLLSEGRRSEARVCALRSTEGSRTASPARQLLAAATLAMTGKGTNLQVLSARAEREIPAAEVRAEVLCRLAHAESGPGRPIAQRCLDLSTATGQIEKQYRAARLLGRPGQHWPALAARLTDFADPYQSRRDLAQIQVRRF